ncbi:MAG: channel protein TolC, partial [Candidatus Promineifilaceae bacterium]
MKINTKRILLPLLWLAMPASVLADNMLSIYQQAVQSDPQLQAAKAAYQATLEVVPQNRAALL